MRSKSRFLKIRIIMLGHKRCFKFTLGNVAYHASLLTYSPCKVTEALVYWSSGIQYIWLHFLTNRKAHGRTVNRYHSVAVGPSINLTQDARAWTEGQTTEESTGALRLASSRWSLLSTSVVILTRSGWPGMEVMWERADRREPWRVSVPVWGVPGRGRPRAFM